jgi:serine/threonine protein phosphatase PrpC
MQALEQHRGNALTPLSVVSRTGRQVNEDLAGWTAAAAWVLDGTTGLTERRLLPGPSDAAWLVQAVDRQLRRQAGDESLTALLRRIVQATRREFEAARIEESGAALERPAASFSLARLRRPGGRIELANVGDCRILYRDGHGRVAAFGSSPVTGFDRQVVEELVRLRGQGTLSYTEAWSRLVETIQRNRTYANREGGYWVLDLTDRWLGAVQRCFLPFAAGDCLLFVSDGFYRLVDTFGFHSDQSLFETALEEGLDELYRRLRAAELEDAECLRFPRIKVHDDATALLVRLETAQ